jgi:hypothetical protein
MCAMDIAGLFVAKTHDALPTSRRTTNGEF